MSRLDELIAELCPDGVKRYSLGTLFIQLSGMGGVSNKWASDGNCRFIDYMNAYKHIAIDVNDLPFATVKKLDQTILRQGDVLFTSASETPDECAVSSVIEDTIQDGIFMDDHLFCLRLKGEYVDKVLPSYLKYVFRSTGFRSQMKSAVRGVTRFYVSKQDFMKLSIPVPPLEVQREIVRILDNFTELTAELTARKQQYEYYCHSLFENANGIKIVTLDQISENCDSQRKPVTSGNRKPGDIPYYGASGIVDYVKDYIFDGDYLLISEDGANLLARSTPIAFSISGKTWVNNHAHVLRFDEYATRRYVEMYLNSIDLSYYITGAAQPKLNQKNLNKIEIPLPDL